MGYAFISYSSKNQQMADSFRTLFNRNGIETWMAPGDIPFGSTYTSTINRAIKGSSCFVLLLSESAQGSPWVLKETERAVSTGKTIFTVLLDDVPMNDDFEFMLSTSQAVAIRKIDENDENIRRLLQAVDAYTVEQRQKSNREQNHNTSNELIVTSSDSKLLNNPDARVRLICVIDTSGSMCGDRIDQLNEGLNKACSSISERYGSEVAIDILQFDTNACWKTADELPVRASGMTNIGEAIKTLVEYGKSIPDNCSCAVMFTSDGSPTDLYGDAMQLLHNTKWYSVSVKTGIAIGEEADYKMLTNIVGSSCAVITVDDNQSFADLFASIATASVKAADKNSYQTTSIEGRNIIDWLDHENIDEEVKWLFRENGTLEIFSGAIIPDYYKPHPQTPWSEHREEIRKIVLRQGVRIIGMHAFYDLPNLEELKIPCSVTDIRTGAFENCQKLTNVEISRQITEIEDYKQKANAPRNSVILWPAAFKNTPWNQDSDNHWVPGTDYAY